MDQGEALALGRNAFDRDAWAEAFRHLAAADHEAALDADDLDRLATSAYLVGEDAAGLDARTRAHQAFLERGDPIRAARSAFWLAFVLLDKPARQAQARGWLARVRRLLDEHGQPCVEEGFWLCAFAFQKANEGDLEAAAAAFAEAARIGARFGNPDLSALARHGEGRLLLGARDAAAGLAVFDEVMVAVTCGEVAPMVAGVVYCSVISACYERFDLGRAQEWTTALARWCAAHPDIVPFRGQCLVRRSELLQLHGAWGEASDEAERACERLGALGDPRDAGAAFYQRAELHRLRGEFDRADDAYRRASLAGRRPGPGLALLRLAQGHADAARTAVRRLLDDSLGARARAQALQAAVEIMAAADDLPGARGAADELARMAEEIDATFLQAAAADAQALVALASGEAAAAATSLGQAAALWGELGAPYELARTRARIGEAYRQLGDQDGAELELEAAQELFERLGAAPDAARVAAMLTPSGRSAPRATGGLTGREVEVLRLVASGRSNRAIATELAISEKTVARHLSNIFTKLDLPSRSAATAYAYRHKLL